MSLLEFFAKKIYKWSDAKLRQAKKCSVCYVDCSDLQGSDLENLNTYLGCPPHALEIKECADEILMEYRDPLCEANQCGCGEDE